MSTTEPSQLREGRERKQRAHRREAIKRVRAYEQWVRSGSDFRTMPAVPRDFEFKLARQQSSAGASNRMRR